MENINDLCDDLLVKILLQIPSKEIVATSLLSKRWRSVWKLVPKLDFRDYEYRYHPTSAAPTEFIDKFLEQNTAPVLETLRLNLCHLRDYSPESFEKWVNLAVSRNVLDLSLLYSFHPHPLRFPTSLYTHETLVTLSLRGAIVEDVVPSETRFLSVKTLSLRDVRFSSDQTVDVFLSCFPVLETLVVRGWMCGAGGDVKTYSIRVASLKRLDIEELVGGYQDPRCDRGYVIDAPRLQFLHVVDHFSGFCSLVNVPEELEAEIHLRFCDSEKLLGSLTSAKKLSLCLKPQLDPCLGDFDQLVSLELCVMCSLDWLNVILKHSPKLRALRLSRTRHSCQNSRNVRTNWEQPNCIPECLMSSLETVEWIAYQGTEEEENVVKYLLENGNLCFKKRWLKVSYSMFSYEILRLGPRSEASSGDGDTTFEEKLEHKKVKMQ